MSPATTDEVSWFRKIMRDRKCRRACGFGVIISSFIICLVGFLLAILAYKRILPAAWVPVGLSCGVPASCICTFTFIYCLFRWNDEANPTGTDQERIERSEPTEETPLLSSSKTSGSDYTDALADSLEVKSDYADALADSIGSSVDSSTKSEFLETIKLKPVVKESEKSEEKRELSEDSGKATKIVSEAKDIEKYGAKLQYDSSEGSVVSEVLDEPKSVDKEYKAKLPCATSEGSGASFAVVDEPKAGDEMGEVKLQCAMTEISMAYFKSDKPKVEICHETKLQSEISESSEVPSEAKEPDSSSAPSKTEDLKSDGSEAPKTPEIVITQDKTQSCEQEPVSKDDH